MEWLQHGQGSTGIRDTGTPVCSKIAGCPPPDPHVRLGGFGVFQGPITPESLRKALRNDLERLGRLTGAILGRLGTETPQNLPSWHEGRGGGASCNFATNRNTTVETASLGEISVVFFFQDQTLFSLFHKLIISAIPVRATFTPNTRVVWANGSSLWIQKWTAFQNGICYLVQFSLHQSLTQNFLLQLSQKSKSNHGCRWFDPDAFSRRSFLIPSILCQSGLIQSILLEEASSSSTTIFRQGSFVFLRLGGGIQTLFCLSKRSAPGTNPCSVLWKIHAVLKHRAGRTLSWSFVSPAEVFSAYQFLCSAHKFLWFQRNGMLVHALDHSRVLYLPWINRCSPSSGEFLVPMGSADTRPLQPSFLPYSPIQVLFLKNVQIAMVERWHPAID